MSVTFSYPAGSASNVPGGGGGTYPLASGLFVCAIPAPFTSMSGAINGVYLQYSQDREIDEIDDATAGLYMGRDKPVVEYGRYDFLSTTQTFHAPATWVNQGSYKPGYGLDGSTRADQCLSLIRLAQKGVIPSGAAGTAGTKYLCYVKDIWGSVSQAGGGSNPVQTGLVGRLYGLKRKPLVDPSGWWEVSFSFVEVQV